MVARQPAGAPLAAGKAAAAVVAISACSDAYPGGTRTIEDGWHVGSVIKKRRKRMAKKKHRKLLKRTRVQRRNKK